MANSVTFPTEYGGSGITITDDADPTTGLDGTGYIERFVPALQQGLAMTGHAVQKAGEADSAAQTASAAAQQASNDRDSINLDLQTLNGLVSDADASAVDAAGSATTASNMADAVAQATATYASVSAGLAGTVDTNYFRVIEAPEAERVSVYRNDAGAATLITTYYTKTGVDAKHSAAVRLNRSLQRLGDNGQTLHSDFNLAAYGLGTPLYGGVQDAVESEELWNGFERLGGTLAYQHTADGSLKYVYVPPNVIAREWNPETQQYQAQISGAVTNELLWSTDFSNAAWNSSVSVSASSVQSPFNGSVFYEVADNSNSADEYLGRSIAVPNDTVTRTASAIVSAGTSNVVRLSIAYTGGTVREEGVWVDLTTGEFLTNGNAVAKVDEISSGVFRISCSVENNGLGNNRARWTLRPASRDNLTSPGSGTLTGSVLLAHAQLVEGTVPGPVIVTESAPVTRAADNISRQLGAEFNTSEGTFIIECEIDASETTQTLYFLGDSDNNRIAQYYSTSDGAILNRFVANGVSYNPPITPVLAGKIRAGVTFKNGLAMFGVNGTTVSSVPASLPNITQALLGRNSENAFYLNGVVRLVKAIPKAVSEPEFQRLVSLEDSQ
ncbi:MAG: hypothetical protein Tp170SUR00d2C46354221_51 [Prokaryotic dsDNA virus sp.]|jgi:hypothetical protein|nr:MAG: hypothetical protein Unbinned4contig1000_8 [Prokaryotic dsDNA virus sp.]QDP48144.1 MAG: hypothetical protein Tp170SUR00d2C46354221_51 [Prokaryotic dsDNA virus sp.]QDP53247.1 MAG: hypothetical protein Unbinned28contig1000_3 [Prokaryotic dsDNA virus sp.]HAO01701.1 hypothetical protein [Halomonas sp.]|tara:strand:- start:34218 stop:36053 length:1836 start_codon:yes stop_codon:yes gene_type:complete